MFFLLFFSLKVFINFCTIAHCNVPISLFHRPIFFNDAKVEDNITYISVTFLDLSENRSWLVGAQVPLRSNFPQVIGGVLNIHVRVVILNG